MFISIVSFSTAVRNYSKKRKEILKSCKEIKAKYPNLDYEFFTTIGKYDFTIIFRSDSEKIIAYIENNHLLESFYFQKYKTAWALNRNNSLDISCSNDFFYTAVCSIKIKKEIFDKNLFNQCIQVFQKKLNGIAHDFYFSIGYEDLLLIIYENSLVKINQSIFNLRGSDIFDLEENNLEKSSKERMDLFLKRDCNANEIFHLVNGTNTNIHINNNHYPFSKKVLDEEDVKIFSQYRTVPGHLDNCQFQLMSSDFQETIGDFDFMNEPTGILDYFKQLDRLRRKNNESFPARKQQSVLIIPLKGEKESHYLNGIRLGRKRNRNTSLVINNKHHLAPHTVLYLQNLYKNVMSLYNRENDNVYIDPICKHMDHVAKKLKTTSKIYESDKRIEKWLHDISILVSNRYLAVHSLLEGGELHNNYFRGYYIKLNYLLELTILSFIKTLSKEVTGKESFYVLFFDINHQISPSFVESMFDSSFFYYPFQFIYKRYLFSTIFHEAMHLYFKNTNVRKKIEYMIDKDTIVYGQTKDIITRYFNTKVIQKLITNMENPIEDLRQKHSEFILFSEKYKTQINNSYKYYRRNLRNDHIIEISQKELSLINSTIEFYLEVICDLSTYYFVYFGDLRKFIIHLVDIINETKIADGRFYNRILCIAVWDTYMSRYVIDEDLSYDMVMRETVNNLSLSIPKGDSESQKYNDVFNLLNEKLNIYFDENSIDLNLDNIFRFFFVNNPRFYNSINKIMTIGYYQTVKDILLYMKVNNEIVANKLVINNFLNFIMGNSSFVEAFEEWWCNSFNL